MWRSAFSFSKTEALLQTLFFSKHSNSLNIFCCSQMSKNDSVLLNKRYFQSVCISVCSFKQCKQCFNFDKKKSTQKCFINLRWCLHACTHPMLYKNHKCIFAKAEALVIYKPNVCTFDVLQARKNSSNQKINGTVG